MTDGVGAQPLISAVHGGRGSEDEDIDQSSNSGRGGFVKEYLVETKKLWYPAGPAIFTSFCEYGLMTIVQIFAGHLGNIQLAAVSVENSIIAGFPFGMMYGMSSALETYCGQAFSASSVRVSNELGSRYPRKARFSVLGSGLSSLLIGLIFAIILMVSRHQYPAIFTDSSEVHQLVRKLTPLLGISIVFTNVQCTLSGVAIGASWQVPVTYLSTVCYFILGLPLFCWSTSLKWASRGFGVEWCLVYASKLACCCG